MYVYVYIYIYIYISGCRDLGGTACIALRLMRPRSFYAPAVVSRSAIMCYILRHFSKKVCVRQVVPPE